MNGSMISSKEELLFSSPTWRHVHKALSRRELLGHHPKGRGALVCFWDPAEGKAPRAVFPSMVPKERNCQSDAEEAHRQAGASAGRRWDRQRPQGQGSDSGFPSLLASTLGKSLPLSEPPFIYRHNEKAIFYQYILSYTVFDAQMRICLLT